MNDVFGSGAHEIAPSPAARFLAPVASRATAYDMLHPGIVDPAEVNVFTARTGTVLFVESSACMHFGSRAPATPRYQFQYSLLSPQRSDLAAMWLPERQYRTRPGDSLLRQLVLDRRLRSVPPQE